MNKKLLAALLSVCCLCAAAFGIAGCGGNSEHEHTYSEDWSTSATQHWHAATCEHTDEKSGVADHTYGDGTVTTAATCTTAGVKTYTCTVCGYTKTEEIAAGHVYDYANATVDWEDWQESESGKPVITVVCTRESSHTLTVDADDITVSSKVTATCTADGKKIYTATFTVDGTPYSFDNPEEETVTADPVYHDYAYDGDTQSLACTVCGHVLCKSGEYDERKNEYVVTIDAQAQTIVVSDADISATFEVDETGESATFVSGAQTYYLKYDSVKDVYTYGYNGDDGNSWNYTAVPKVENFNLDVDDFAGVYKGNFVTGSNTENNVKITVSEISIYYDATSGTEILVTMSKNGNTFTQKAEITAPVAVDKYNRIKAWCNALGYFYIEALDSDATQFRCSFETFSDVFGDLTKTDETPTALPTSISGLEDGTYTATSADSAPSKINVTGGKVYIYGSAGAEIVGENATDGYRLADYDSGFDPCDYVLKVETTGGAVTLYLYQADGTTPIGTYTVQAASDYPTLTAGYYYPGDEGWQPNDDGYYVYKVEASGTYKITAYVYSLSVCTGSDSSAPNTWAQTTGEDYTPLTLTLEAGTYVFMSATNQSDMSVSPDCYVQFTAS